MVNQNIYEGILLGMGNPLLDIQTTVTKEFLDKYSLKENDAILADDSHIPLFEELLSMKDTEFIPGGATQNALRVSQWIIQKPNCCTFFGAVGDDKYGKTLKEITSLSGVNAKYQLNSSIKTGTCAVLINGSNRSLAAHLAAANTFNMNHFDDPSNVELVKKAKYYYISGFFLTVCPQAIQYVAKHSSEENKTFAMNLAAPFICQFFNNKLNEALPYVDIIFGNESEAEAYAESNNFNTKNLNEIALKLASLPKVNKNKERLVIITQGDKPTIVVKNNIVTEYPINSIPKEKLVDTNGAGDAFCGGFFSQFIQEKDLDECIKCANYAAMTIIQHQGCTLPKTCEYH
ncbi:Adenosine kinase [Strongyloides ratti]|uniref:Adenosine kinase n=1 Tax=Strongyloides ratti TaxID=34506 RepID=A0A090MR78_STRRB|nr:Adenosine kinase [Strongyloides ratti]CEF60678.1 Adenosine kinase [Strongyloides ratti]